jgi:IS30 family transposase
VVLTGQLSNHALILPATGGERPVAQPRSERRNRSLSSAEASELVASHRAGATVRGLARALGVHCNTVQSQLDRAGITRDPTNPTLTSAQVDDAVERYQAGDSWATIATVLGVCDSTVGRALKARATPMRPRKGGPHT